MKDSKNGILLTTEAAKAGGEIISQELVLAGRGLGLRDDQLNTFISRSIERTGKANTALLRESASAAAAAGKTLGVGAKELMPIITEVMANTERFGNVGAAAAARISAQVLQLGIDFSDLDRVVSGFQGFEGAAGNVAKLTAAFGVNLDAMQLMYDANEDQEQMLLNIRDAFDDAGISVNDMTLAQKRLLSESLGGIGVDKIDRILGPLGEGLDQINEKTKVSTEQAILDATTGFKDAIKDLSEVILDPFEQFKTTASAKISAAAGRMAAEAMGELNKSTGGAIQDLTDTLGDKLKGPSETVLQLLKGAVVAPLNEADLSAKGIGDKLQEIVAQAREQLGLVQATRQEVAALPTASPSTTPAPVPEAPPAAPTVPTSASGTTGSSQIIQQPGPGGSTMTIRIEFTDEAKKTFKAYQVLPSGATKEISTDGITANPEVP
jgi:hypothetical protein